MVEKIGHGFGVGGSGGVWGLSFLMMMNNNGTSSRIMVVMVIAKSKDSAMIFFVKLAKVLQHIRCVCVTE